jgi:hypothetical protein
MDEFARDTDPALTPGVLSGRLSPPAIVGGSGGAAGAYGAAGLGPTVGRLLAVPVRVGRHAAGAGCD